MAGPSSQKETPEGSGERIRNARVRYNDQRSAFFTENQIQRETQERKAANDGTYVANNAEYTGKYEKNVTTSIQDTKRVITEIKQMFRSQQEDLSDAELDEMTKLNAKPAPLPDFPYMIVSLAIFKDILDFGDVIIVGIIITTALSFLIGVVLFFWTMGKVSGGWWKKRLIKKLWTKYVFAIAIEFIPFLKIIPTTTIFVLLAHYDETKVVKLINASLERLRSTNFLNS